MATDAGYDTGVWTRMAGQLGLLGLVLPEEYGGSGGGWTDLVVVLEEMGRALLCAPFLATVALAGATVAACPDEDLHADVLPAIADGRLIATVATAEDVGSWDDDGVHLRGDVTPDGWRLTGHKSFVLDGQTADLVLVSARTGHGVSLFAVDGTAPGLSRRRLVVLDPTRKLARLEFAAVAARLIGAEGQASELLHRVRDLGAVALAAEQIGGAARCLEMSVEYAKLRHQFGRPIGSFQAIKHMCADMLIDLEWARSAVYEAAWAIDEGHGTLPADASLAKACASQAFAQIANRAIQIHGGIGFTWENDLHLYFRRAKSGELLFGTPTYHREQFMRHIALTPYGSEAAIASPQ
jgi:alkylation response protein AidB-like acyl-CoA dehydrogenase